MPCRLPACWSPARAYADMGDAWSGVSERHSTYTSQDLRLCLIKCCAVSTAARIRRCGCSCVQCLHGGGRGVSDVYARVGAEREREMCRDLKNSVSRAFVAVNCPFAFVLTTLICAIPHWFSPLVPVPFLICSHHSISHLSSHHSISHPFSPLNFSSVLATPFLICSHPSIVLYMCQKRPICVKRGLYVSKESTITRRRLVLCVCLPFSSFSFPSFPCSAHAQIHGQRNTFYSKRTHSIVREHIL